MIGPLMVDQSREQVPMEPWQVIGPDGAAHGKKYPGKLALLREIDPILDGSRVEDSEWMNMNAGQIAPAGVDPTLPLGSRYHLRQQIEEVFSDMTSKDVEVLTALYGLDPAAYGSADVEQKDEGRRVNPLHVITAVELSDRLGLAPEDASRRDKQRKAKAAVDRAQSHFQEKAKAKGYRSVADRSRNWNRMISPQRVEIAPASGPSHRDLVERFGSDQAVSIYGAGVRAGNGEATAKKLEKLKAGKLSAKDRDSLMRDYIEQRDKERLAEFRRQTAHHTVDPSEVSEVGPGTGTPADADWLYTPQLLSGAMRAVVNNTGASRSSGDRKPAPSGVMSEERFADFMGRGQQFAQSQTPKQRKQRKKVKKGGDNNG